MRESINYYYNLNVSELENWGNVYSFKLNNSNFYFVPIKRANEELEDIIEVSKELKIKGLEVHDIIFNKFGKIITNVYNENYCLLKVIGDIYQEYDLSDLLKINQKLILNPNKSKLYRNSWAKLWSDKIDYFEYQVHELGKDKPIILDSFSYYVGLGENAISYVNDTISKYKPTENDRITLSHKRVNYPNYKLNYLNPLSFIFDLEIRDISEFIKSAFINNEDALSYLKEVLSIKKFSIYSLSLLYARLLYPSFYFDIYERVMNNEIEEEKLIPIIDKCHDYEIFLKKAYFEISKYAPITRVEWLLKKEL
ncbi:MAG: hypothetical protein NC483_07220 [Ruminococcus sp.]|nr:hypothetical protein [Ruminococcus sp.]